MVDVTISHAPNPEIIDEIIHCLKVRFNHIHEGRIRKEENSFSRQIRVVLNEDWRGAPASIRQLTKLVTWGVNPPDGLTKGQADIMIRKMIGTYSNLQDIEKQEAESIVSEHREERNYC